MSEPQYQTTTFLVPPLNSPDVAASLVSNGSATNLPVLEDEKLEKIENILIRHETDDALHTVVSALYGKLLVVMGIVFPIIDALTPGTFTRFNGFYLCLSMGSITFMMYIYAMHLKEEARTRLGLLSPDQTTRQPRYGSNYLRAGVAGFGIGSMIFSGLEFGRYFEINKLADCHSWLIAISPLCRIIFVLMQMLYVFSNNKLHVLGNTGPPLQKTIIRYGLMHMIATNLCEWLYVLVEETKQDIKRAQHIRKNRELEANQTWNSSKVEPCWNSQFMKSLIHNSSPYLFPCTVEYSLLCAVILGVMWHNMAHKADMVMQRDRGRDRAAKSATDHSGQLMLLSDRQSGVNIIYSYTSNVSKFSVDCANSHKGLFSGILILVLTIISLIMFFELVHVNLEMAVLQVNIWEAVLFATAISATIACAAILRNVGYRRHRRNLELEHILLLVTQIGVFLYFLFQIFGGYYYMQSENSPDDTMYLVRMITPIAALIQSSCQTVLVLDAWRRQCTNEKQYRNKPGRELVTFLLICNLALWIVNRLKNNSAEFHPMQMEFYGTWGWTVITHVTMPLVVCYRFQSTVCLYEIWKHVYKNPRRHARFYHNCSQ